MTPDELLKSTLAPASAGGFSFLELFLQAHLVVKIVMIGLLLASVWSWAIIVEKLVSFRRARVEADRFEQMFWSGQSLDELYGGLMRGKTITMGALFVAAMREWKRSVEGNIRALGGIQLRVEKVMDVTISREMERLDRRLLFLATVGSTAPFIGLFGTVWGIMTSFQAIAISKNTNLAVVAPGIAEALFATALGLLAAIPAVIFYNKFAADLGAHRAAAGSLRRRVRGHRLAPDRRADLKAEAHGGQRQDAGKRRRRRRKGRRHAPMSEINVTPFVDVMLVLLIIFMVAAPLLTVGVPIELPQAKGKQLQANKEPLAISVKSNGEVYIGETMVGLEEIAGKLSAIAKNGYDEPVFVRGDKGVTYGIVMRVMGRISAGGFKKVSLVTEVEDGG